MRIEVNKYSRGKDKVIFFRILIRKLFISVVMNKYDKAWKYKVCHEKNSVESREEIWNKFSSLIASFRATRWANKDPHMLISSFKSLWCHLKLSEFPHVIKIGS